MRADVFPAHFKAVDRRRFLALAGSMFGAAAAVAPVELSEGVDPRVARKQPPQARPCDLGACNLGLITASRREFTPADNAARNSELLADLRRFPFRVLHLRGRYILISSPRGAEPTNEHSYLVIGNRDDSGNLKGFLRKYGRKYGQDSVIHRACTTMPGCTS